MTTISIWNRTLAFIQFDDDEKLANMVMQSLHGIVNCKGTETFAKEPKLAKLLRELKPTFAL